jgi:hypothetical protein
MTRREAEALLRETEGRLCARLYRRADGTILTENCPVGLRAIGRRISRMAGAAMSAFAAVSSATAAQFPFIPVSSLEQGLKPAISGTVVDSMGAVIPGAEIKLVADKSGAKFDTKADATGRFRFDSLIGGLYTVHVVSSGFSSFTKTVNLGLSEYALTVSLDFPAIMGETVDLPYEREPYARYVELPYTPLRIPSPSIEKK